MNQAHYKSTKSSYFLCSFSRSNRSLKSLRSMRNSRSTSESSRPSAPTLKLDVIVEVVQEFIIRDAHTEKSSKVRQLSFLLLVSNLLLMMKTIEAYFLQGGTEPFQFLLYSMSVQKDKQFPFLDTSENCAIIV